MSLYCAWVGEIKIKSEFRADFGYLFRGEYDKIESGPIADYVKRWKNDMLPLCHWKHYDEEGTLDSDARRLLHSLNNNVN